MKFRFPSQSKLKTSTKFHIPDRKKITTEAARPTYRLPPKSTNKVTQTKTGTKTPTKTAKGPRPAGLKPFNMPPLRELERKYKAFADHDDLYQEAFRALAYLQNNLCDNTLIAETGIYGTSMFPDSSDNAIRAIKKNTIGKRNNKTFNYMKVTPNYIETRITIPNINLKIGFQNDSLVRSAHDQLTKVIQVYFPDFKMPTTFGRMAVEGFEDQKVARPVGKDCEQFISLEKFVTLRPQVQSQNNKWGDPYMKMPKNYTANGYSNVVYLDLKLNMSEARVDYQYGLSSSNENGTLYGDSKNSITIPIDVDLVFRWPTMFAYYVTCCTHPSEFIPFMFFQYVTWHKYSYSSATTRGGGRAIKAPARVNHLGNIIDLIEEEKKRGRDIKPRTNEDGFILIGSAEPSKTGSIMWVPPNENRVPEFLSIIKGAYVADEEKIDFRNAKMAGVGLLTDWHNEKFSFMLEHGISTETSNISGVKTIDLAGSIPLDAITIRTRLNQTLEATKLQAENFASLMQKFSDSGLSDEPLFDPDIIGKHKGLEKFATLTHYSTGANTLMSRLINSTYDITWANLGGQPIEANGEDDVDLVNMLNAICEYFRKIAAEMLQKFEQVPTNYEDRIFNLRFILILVTKYGGPAYKKITEEAKARSERNITKVEGIDDVNRIKLPNLPGVDKLMPHQVQSFNALSTSPENALIDISMGGGKSLLSIAECVQLIFDKKIKRGILIVPGNLVRNTINEVVKFSKGTLNPFALTLQVARRINIVVNPDDPSKRPNYDVLKKLIEGAPPNTVFICNYRFLIADTEEIIYGNDMIRRYYAAEFLRDLGFDFVGEDESHFAKNLNSQQTQAASILVSAAKYKRLLSGTMVNNTLTDLVGQVAQVNPAIFKTAGHFNNKYGLEVSGNNVIAWLPDAAKKINADLRPYAMRITHKRQAWAFMLPTMHEQFHPVNLTDNQRQFYNQLLEEALEEIQSKNPALWKKMQTGDESDVAAIQQGLDTHFQRIEEFLVSPESNAAYQLIDGLTPEDLISPKVGKIVEILDGHFNGILDNATGKYVQKPNKHKVIIFSQRRATSKHIFKHLPPKYRSMAVHYQAGDQKAIDTFQKTDKIKILVADEMSINTGNNFQISSRLIRLEALWAPGNQDQALARIWRPAFGDGKDRTDVYMDWLFTNHSLEVTKIGRLVSKIVDKIKYDRQEEKSFTHEPFNFVEHSKGMTEGQRANIMRQIPATRDGAAPIDEMLPSLPILKMNTSTMQNFNNASMLAEYFATYALVNLWEDVEFNRQKASGKQRLIQVPDTAYVEIPGSKKLNYIPRVPGVDPLVFDPQNKFGYQPISVLDMEASMNADTDGDEDSEVYIEINSVEKGELVDTEFGFGEVTKLNQDSIWVDIKGLGKVQVPKACAWVITNPQAKAAIKAQLKSAGKRGMPRFPGSIVDSKSAIKPLPDDTGVKPKVKPTIKERLPEKDPKLVVKQEEEKKREIKTGRPPKTERKYNTREVDVDDFDNEIEIFAEMVDGQPALTCFAEDADSDVLVNDFDFKPLDEYIAIKIIGPKTFDQVMEVMSKNFRVNPDNLETLNRYRPYLVKKALGQIRPTEFRSAMRFVAVEAHRQLKPDALRPFPMVWGKFLYFCFIKGKTPALPKLIAKLKRANITPALKFTTQADLHVKLYPGPIKAINELKQIKKVVNVPNYDETLQYLRSLKGTARK